MTIQPSTMGSGRDDVDTIDPPLGQGTVNVNPVAGSPVTVAFGAGWDNA
jgi:hypothetical protein